MQAALAVHENNKVKKIAGQAMSPFIEIAQQMFL